MIFCSVKFVRNTHCLSKELRPVTRSSSASSLMSLETRSSTNWSSFVCLDDPVDEVVEDELELGSEPVIMAVDVVGKLKLSPSVNFRHLYSIFAKLETKKTHFWTLKCRQWSTWKAMSTFFTIAELLSFLAFPCNAKLSFCLQLYYSRPRRTTSFKIMSFFDLFLSPSHVSFCVSQIFWPFWPFNWGLLKLWVDIKC